MRTIPNQAKTKQDRPFWSVVKAKAEPAKAELLIYGEISDYEWWGDEVTPKSVNEMLKALGEDVTDITLRVNSPGGGVFAGVAIHSMLKRHPATITAYVDGLAASIASIIILAADKIIMPKGALLMHHKPMGSIWWANATAMRKRAELLDKIEDEMIGLYSGKSGMTAEQLKPLLETETWYTADEAKEAGFVDEIEGELEVAACLRGDVAVINGVEVNWKTYKNAPILPVEATNPEPVPIQPQAKKTPVSPHTEATQPIDNDDKKEEDIKLKIAVRQRELELKYRR